MEDSDGEPVRTPDQMMQMLQQLLIYARELGEHFRIEDALRKELSGHEQRIREIMADSMAAQEEERQWIALEVHDRIAQTLAAAFHQAQTLESLSQGRQKSYDAAVRASSLIREAIRESRSIMNGLHPPGLAEYGLVPLMQDELRRFQEETGCMVSFHADCPARPYNEVEISLYRIFHEAITNVRKHAGSATILSVSLTCRDSVAHLEVKDNGPGFDVSVASGQKRVGGLMSMRRRATIVGGKFEIISAPREGTHIIVRVPANGHKSQ
ncbi:MAG: sensor histidine kinase [Chloroflexi bacterium]|nr:sensor histidine kinase [Chloroflexota bacterium]